MKNEIDHYQEYLTVLEKILVDKDDETKVQILNKVIQTGVEPDDPLLPVLTMVGNVQVAAEEIPDAIEISLHKFLGAVHNLMDGLETKLDSMALKALKQHEGKITDTVREIFRKKESLEWQSVRVILPALGIFCGIYGLGMITGVMGIKLFNPSSPSQLSQADRNELKWAKSREGKFAKNLYRWNKEIIGNNCEKELQNTGIKLLIEGKRINSGICVLWIKPPPTK